MGSKVDLYHAVPPELQGRFPEWERLACVISLDTAFMRCCGEALGVIGADAMSGAPALMARRGDRWLVVASREGLRKAFMRIIAESIAYEIYTMPVERKPCDRAVGIGNVTRVHAVLLPTSGSNVVPLRVGSKVAV